ncbi:MAG: hypothetical protein ACI38U_02240 [Corynebacterium sp.]|uniref:hypothetical protein n=1 Tax=Corynebacterium sp. TaxID=1720 RepID=UPI003F0FFC8F
MTALPAFQLAGFLFDPTRRAFSTASKTGSGARGVDEADPKPIEGLGDAGYRDHPALAPAGVDVHG